MPIAKKIHRLERAQYAFLDHSKPLVFSDVIKIEIIFKYSRARAIRTYSSRAKKLYRATLSDFSKLITLNKMGEMCFHLIGTNGFHVKAESKRLTAVGSCSRQNLKF